MGAIALPARRPSAGAVPGRWGLLGGKDPTGRSTRLYVPLDQDPEHVVVARGGVVGEDGRQQVGARYPARLEVQPAALALPAAASEARCAANGDVVLHRGAREGDDCQGVLEDPVDLAIAAVAARAPGAAEGEVVVHGRAADGERRSEEIGETAAPAIAAVAAGPSRAADHGVVADGAVADGDDHPVAE